MADDAFVREKRYEIDQLHQQARRATARFDALVTQVRAALNAVSNNTLVSYDEPADAFQVQNSPGMNEVRHVPFPSAQALGNGKAEMDDLPIRCDAGRLLSC